MPIIEICYWNSVEISFLSREHTGWSGVLDEAVFHAA